MDAIRALIELKNLEAAQEADRFSARLRNTVENEDDVIPGEGIPPEFFSNSHARHLDDGVVWADEILRMSKNGRQMKRLRWHRVSHPFSYVLQCQLCGFLRPAVCVDVNERGFEYVDAYIYRRYKKQWHVTPDPYGENSYFSAGAYVCKSCLPKFAEAIEHVNAVAECFDLLNQLQEEIKNAKAARNRHENSHDGRTS